MGEEYCKKNPSTGGCEKYRNCCQANTAECNSCKEGISEEEYCKKAPSDVFGPVQGCEKYNCCQGNHARCNSCKEGLSEEEYCKKKPKAPGCERNFHDCKKDPSASGCKWFKCCRKFTSKCFACAQDKSEEEVCRIMKNYGLPGCEKFG